MNEVRWVLVGIEPGGPAWALMKSSLEKGCLWLREKCCVPLRHGSDSAARESVKTGCVAIRAFNGRLRIGLC
jgi:hypothetical protein